MSVIVDEAMLREPNLLIPGKKPAGSVRVDPDSPIIPSDTVIFLGGHPVLRNMTSVDAGSLTGTPSVDVLNGDQAAITSFQNTYYTGGAWAGEARSTYSLFIEFINITSSGNSNVFLIGGTGNGLRPVNAFCSLAK